MADEALINTLAAWRDESLNELCWTHFMSPQYSGSFDDEGEDVYSVLMGARSNRAVVQLAVRQVSGRIVWARFKAKGGVYVIAMGSVLCGALQDKETATLEHLSLSQLFECLKIPVDQSALMLLWEDVVRTLWQRMVA